MFPKIVFFGTPEFAVASLDALVQAGYPVVGVVTAPDKPAGRHKELKQSDVKRYALGHGLTLMQPEKLRSEEFLKQLRDLDADLFVVIAFRMLPEVVWSMPPMGTFNLHGSLLPRYRGAAPINWAIIQGEKQTGVTTFLINHDIDTGDVLSYSATPIADDDNFETLYNRLMDMGATLTLDTVKALTEGTATPTPQHLLPGCRQACPAPKLCAENTHLHPTALTAQKARNLIRGLSPWPGAWATLEADGNELGTFKLLDATVTDIPSATPGLLEAVVGKGVLYLHCADTLLQLNTIQSPGKRRMSAADFVRGLRHTHMLLS